MKARVKKPILFGLLAVTVIAAWFAPKAEDNALVLPTARAKAEKPVFEGSSGHQERKSEEKQLSVLRIKPRGQIAIEGDSSARLFEKVSWGEKEQKVKSPAEAQAPAAPSVSPPPIQAPPLPFQIIGQYKEGARSGVFLQYMNNNYVIYAGDTIFEYYKVESIDESSVKFRFLPLDQIQQLPIGSPPN